MDKLTLDLTFPLGGIDRSAAFSAQGPQTTLDALNVVPQDVFLGRMRGGSRMGLEKHSLNLFGPAQPVRLVAQITRATGAAQLVAIAGSNFYHEDSPDLWTSNATVYLSSTGRKCYAVLDDKIFIADTGVTSPYYYEAGTASGGAHSNPLASPLGDVPTNCSVVANIGNRLVLAGDSTDKRAYYMSRPGDPNDFAYGDTDDERAVTGNLEVGGVNSDGIKAVIPWYADYSIWACESSISLLVGTNFVNGAYFFPISNRLGALDSMSWCYGPARSIYLMTRDGLARCNPGEPRAEPELVSPERIPRELLAIDPDVHEVTLIWDSRYQLIHIFIAQSTYSGTPNDHWAYSLRGGGFFRMRYDDGCEPFSACAYPGLTSTGTNIILGCRDGYIRRFSLAAANDDGVNFDSYALLGPVRPSGNEDQDGKILEVVGVFAEDSGEVDYEILPGATPEEAYAASSSWSGSFTSGRSVIHRPRLRSGDALFKVSGTPGIAWSMEKLRITTAAGGRQR